MRDRRRREPRSLLRPVGTTCRLGVLSAALSALVAASLAVPPSEAAGAGEGTPTRTRSRSGLTEEEMARRRLAVAGTAATSEVRLTESLTTSTPDGEDRLVEQFEGVTDPLGDVYDPRADVTSAGVDATDVGLVHIGLIVDEYSDPYTDPAWVYGDTGPSWEFDVDLDGYGDYLAVFFNIDGELLGAVLDTMDNFVCPIYPSARPQFSGYQAVLDIGCIGNPEMFGWYATMGYDGDVGGFEFDDAPDTTWAGPTVNAFYAPPPTTTPPTGSSDLVPVVPVRLLDTRSGSPVRTVAEMFATVGRLPAGSVTELKVAGRAGVPAGASAAMMNLTAVRPDATGFFTVFPCGEQIPNTSNVNYRSGDIVPNAVLAKIGTSGKVCIYTSAGADMVVDVNGYVPAGRSPITVLPARVLDTRTGIGRRSAGSVTELQVADRAGVPADASAVMMNLTAVRPDATGFFTVFPCGQPIPNTSNVNYRAGSVVPNAVLAKIGVGGQVCIYTSSGADMIADVNGYVPGGASPATVLPARLLETRIGPDKQTTDGQSEGIGRRSAGSVTELKVAGRANVPADASAVMMNLTAIRPDGTGFLTVFPCGQPIPNASNVNYRAGSISPNAVLAKIGTGGKVCIFTFAATDMIADVNGYVP